MSELPHWTEPGRGKEVNLNDADGNKPVFHDVEVAGTGELVQNQTSTKSGVTFKGAIQASEALPTKPDLLP